MFLRCGLDVNLAIRSKSNRWYLPPNPIAEESRIESPLNVTHASPNAQRQAAIAVIFQDQRFLVIERSQTVRAPGKLCFPGGGVEAGETVAEAVVRELNEELNLVVRPRQQVWQSCAPSGCLLNWVHVEFDNVNPPRPNPDEVASWHWMTAEEMKLNPNTLASNIDFIHLWQRGVFELS